MRYAASVSALAFAAVAVAQDTSVAVNVGKGGLIFDPPSFNATVNSTVSFVFSGSPGNHTVSQSSFATPCAPLDGGFSSGFVVVGANSTQPAPVWNLTITDTKPIWFFCAQDNVAGVHCNLGMVGAINAPATGNTFDKFQAAAKAETSVTAPPNALTGVGAFATAAPSAPPSPSSGSGSGSSGAASGTSSGSPAASGTASGNGVASTGVNGLVALVAAAFGVALL